MIEVGVYGVSEMYASGSVAYPNMTSFVVALLFIGGHLFMTGVQTFTRLLIVQLMQAVTLTRFFDLTSFHIMLMQSVRNSC